MALKIVRMFQEEGVADEALWRKCDKSQKLAKLRVADESLACRRLGI